MFAEGEACLSYPHGAMLVPLVLLLNKLCNLTLYLSLTSTLDSMLQRFDESLDKSCELDVVSISITTHAPVFFFQNQLHATAFNNAFNALDADTCRASTLLA